MSVLPDHYAVLGIRPTADQEVIAAAYRALAKKYHPDTARSADAESASRFHAVQQAYEVLGHPDRRRAYDGERQAAGQYDAGEKEAAALPGDEAWLPAQRSAGPGQAGPRPYSTRPRETVLRAPLREAALREEEGGGLFRFALAAVLVCLIAGGALVVLWPSLSGSSGGRGAEALAPPPQPESQPAPRPSGAVKQTAAPPQEELPQEAPPIKPAKPRKTVSTPAPAGQPATVDAPQPASLFALTMRETSGGAVTTLADGTLTFNSRKSCEDFAAAARQRRLDASTIETGEAPEITWECKSR